MKNRTFNIIFVVSLFTMLFISSCNEFIETQIEFPDTEIIYQSGNREEMAIGFINSDGSNKTSISTNKIISHPLWTDDGKHILFIEPPGGIINVNYPGRPSIWVEGDGIKTCKNYRWRNVKNIFDISHETNQAIIIINNQIILVDVFRCKELETLFVADNTVLGVSISSDGNKLLYSSVDNSAEMKQYRIYSLDIGTKKEEFLTEGINPMWSSDEEKIVYTMMDGIYIIGSDGLNQKKVTSYNATWREIHFEKAPPAPVWSPDDGWIIYHKCPLVGEDCMIASDFSIYRFNVSSRKEEILTDGGAYPYWRGR
jgi:Tol biopolymer transport system component